MTSSSSAVSDELASLHARVRHYESEIVRRDVLLEQRAATIEQRDATIEQLQEQVRLLLAKRFGASSEKLPDGQLGLFNEAEATAAEEPESDCATEVAAHRRARAKRAPLPETLERVDIEHRLEESQRTCPHHGVELERFGEVVSEQLDIVPAKVRVLRHIRGKYRCPSCEGHLRTAAMPAQPVPKSLATPDCSPASPRRSTPMRCRCIASASNCSASGWSSRHDAGDVDGARGRARGAAHQRAARRACRRHPRRARAGGC